MARITMELTTNPAVDPEAVQRWIGDGLALERNENDVGEEEGEQVEQRASTAPRYTAAAANEPSSAPRRGRRTNAEKAAEREAAEAAQMTPNSLPTDTEPPPVSSPPPQQVGASSPASPSGNAFPPGIAPPGVHHSNGATPPPPIATAAQIEQVSLPVQIVQPIPAAMSKSEPLPPAENGIMRLDEFRTANMQVQKARPGKMSMLMRSTIWPSDKSPKDAWFTVDAVPGEFRYRLFEELDQVP